MLFGNHEPKTSGGRRETFRPRADGLEERVLMAVADLANVASTPLGVQLAGKSAAQGVGYSVAMLGDTNGDGFQDVVVGAPGINPTSNGVAQNFNVPATPFLANGTGAAGVAYLVFGSSQAQSGPKDFKTLTSGQRTGGIAQLGNAAQTNPAIAGSPNAVGFPFNGVTFTTGLLNVNDGLGASVADAGIIPTPTGANSTLHSFLLGAPGTDKAYLVLASPSLVPSGTTALSVALNAPPAGINVVTFTSPTPTDQVGRNVSFVPNLFGNNVDYIAITAPNYTKAGVRSAVFLIPTTSLATMAGKSLDVTKTGTAAGIAGEIEFDNPALPTLFSDSIAVSSVTNFDGLGATDLLIGLPDNLGGKGEADVIYGGPPLKPLIPANGILNLGSVGVTGTGAIPGAQFQGTNIGEAAGYSVSSALDFNFDGTNDIVIGSPGFGTDQGKATVIYGRPSGSAFGAIMGIKPLDSLSVTTDPVNFAIFIGDNNKNNNNATAPSGNYLQNALAGFSVSVANGPTAITGKNPDLLIGSPGVNFSQTGATTSGQGAVYVIPASATTLSGTFQLTSQAQQTISALIIDDSSKVDQSQGVTVAGVAGPLGTQVGVSVSATQSLSSTTTLDSDSVPDIAIGAPLSSLSVNNFAGGNQAGSLFMVEGSFLTTLGNGSSGGGTGGTVSGGGGGASAQVVSSIIPPLAPITAAQIAPGSQFGPDRWSPPLAAFSQFNYVPIAQKVAYAPYYPSFPFQQRIKNYYHPSHVKNQYGSKGGHNTHGDVTLSQSVFNRSKYKTGKVIQFTHHVPVFPVQRQTERYSSTGGAGRNPKK